MRLLLTGLSQQQCGGQPLLRYVTVSSMIKAALEDAGHQVDNRKYTWDEDIRSYDAVVLGMVPPFSIGAGNLYSGLKAFADCLRFKVPVLLYVDDPNYYQFKNQYPSINRGLHRIYRESMYAGRLDYENARTDESLMGKTIEWLATRQWPTLVRPTYDWGDHSLMPYVNTVRLVDADPSSYAPRYPFEVPEQRERAWVIGGIVNSSDWIAKQSLTWPVEMYGNAKYNTHGRLKEPDLVARFAKVHGVLCQPRPRTNASGWWRSRYLFAAQTKTIVFGDPKDVHPLGDVYLVPGSDVEKMSVTQLHDLASRQSEHFLSLIWPRERYSRVFDEALQVACAEHEKFVW